MDSTVETVTLGGGSGQSNLLWGLKNIPSFSITAVVSSADSGGSSEVLRTAHDILPPGDFRRCLTALATTQDPDIRYLLLDDGWREGDEHRLSGHPVFNLLFAHAVTKGRSVERTLRAFERVLKTRGRVLPVTLSRVDLCAEFENGEQVRGEHLIDTGKHAGEGRIVRLWLESRRLSHHAGKTHGKGSGKIKAFRPTVDAIRKARLVVVSPGDLFTSILPNVLLREVAQALCATRAKIIFVANLMTKRAETAGFAVHDFVEAFEHYSGRKVDYVVCNQTPVPKYVADQYAKEGAVPVVPPESGVLDPSTVVVCDDILEISRAKKDGGKPMHLARHQADRLAEVILLISRGRYD